MLNKTFHNINRKKFRRMLKISSDVSNAVIDSTKLRGVKEYQHFILIYYGKEDSDFDQ